MCIGNTYNELKFNFEDEFTLRKAMDERKIKWKANKNPEHLTQNELDEVKIEGLKVNRSKIVSELSEDIGDAIKVSETRCKVTEGEKRLANIKIMEDLEKGKDKDKDIDKNIDIKEPSNDLTDIKRSSILNLDLEKNRN